MYKNDFISSAFLRICFLNFMMMLGQTMTNTLIPKYIDSLGSSPVLVGFVTSAFSISSLITKPISGPAIDAFKKKYILLLGNVLILISFIGYSFSTTVLMMVIFRLLHGFGLGFTVIACLTIVSELVHDARLTTAIAYYSVAGAIAQAIGPGLGLKISEYIGIQNTFLFGAFFMLIAVFVSFTIKTQNVLKKFEFSFSNILAKEALLPASIMFFLSLVNVCVSSFLVIFALEINVTNIGLFFTVNAIFLLISRPIIGSLSDRFGIVKVLPLAIISLGLSSVLIGYSTNITMFLIAAILNAFGYGACQPLIQSLTMKSVSKSRRGIANATTYYGIDFGYMFGPLIAGYIVEQLGYSEMFKILPLLLIFALLIFYFNKAKISQIDQS